MYFTWIALRWRHNDHAGVSNHQPHGCLLNRLFRRTSKKTSKLRVTGLCAGNSPGTGEFPAQMASYAENVSIWWRHHEEIWYQNAICHSDIPVLRMWSQTTATKMKHLTAFCIHKDVVQFNKFYRWKYHLISRDYTLQYINYTVSGLYYTIPLW